MDKAYTSVLKLKNIFETNPLYTNLGEDSHFDAYIFTCEQHITA